MIKLIYSQNIYTISSGNVRDIYFAQSSQLTNLVKNESTRLRNEENCDFIIYSIHGDTREDYYDTDLSVDGYVDLVLEGHSHQDYCYQDDGGVYHVQGKANNMQVYEIEVELDLVNKTHSVYGPDYHDFSYSGSSYKYYPEDSGALAIMNKYYDQYSIAYETVGQIDSYKSSYELRTKVGDLYYENGIKKWSSYDIVCGGGYISCRASGISAGSVQYSDLYECFPFDNDIVLCAISGSRFISTQFITGSSNYFVKWKDGALSSSDVDPSKTYYLVTDTYTTDYYYPNLQIIDYYASNTYARDFIADYIREGNWTTSVTPPPVQTHAGTISDPKTIAEARELAAQYSSSGASTGYYFKGTVCQMADYWNYSTGELRNVYVEDKNQGNGMQIYYLNKFNGADTSNGNFNGITDLVYDDEIIFYGKPFTYNSSTLEFARGAYLYSINGVVTGPTY